MSSPAQPAWTPPAADAWKPPAVDAQTAPAEQPKSVLDHIENAARNFWSELSNAGAGMVNMVTTNPVKTVRGIGESQDALRQKAADALSRGDIVEAARHALSYAIPVLGPSIDAAGDQAQTGDVSGAAGRSAAIGLMSAAPGALEHPSVVPALETAAAATKGALKGAAQASVEPINYGRFHLPVPAPVAGAAAGGYAAGQLGLPHSVGAVIGAATPIIRGAVSGAKAALADRIAAATEAMAPEADLLSKAVPLSPEQEAFARQILASTEPQPVQAVQPRALLNAPPQRVLQMPSGPDTSFVRAIPAEYPIVIHEPPAGGYAPGSAGNLVQPRTLPQTEAAMAQKSPAPTEAPRSMYTATGELKSPQLRAAEITGQNVANKAERFAQALHDAGVTAAEARQIPVGRLSESQISQGGVPGWGNITDALMQKGVLKAGENPPNQSIPQIISGLRKLEAQKIAQQLADEMKRSGTVK